MRRIVLIALAAIAFPLWAQQRLASDFEIEQMEQQLARSRDFESQISGRLNLGDVRAVRNETSLARTEYRKALELAQNERLEARRASSLARYANATSYAALVQAKLGREAEAYELLEESVRYASDDPEAWNIQASAMRTLGHPRKAVSAARNAVSAARKPLDIAIYRHALATALIDSGETREAEQLLVQVTASLRSREFESLQRAAAQAEAFEVYGSARGDVAAYVSLLNRSQLRLADLYEKKGDLESARTQYERVLEGRSDDPSALASLARLARNDDERERLFARAFEANPFSMTLIRAYREYAATHPSSRAATDVQRAVQQLQRGERRAARETLDALLVKFPQNETLRALRREAESRTAVTLPSPSPTAAELRALIDGFERLTAEQRVALDRATFTSVVSFEGQPGNTFAAGTIDGVPFRFGEPIVFAGTFDVHARLTYRILGAGANGSLLLEPLQLENLR